MASMTSKRQQARNERTLQDLIKSVPGNDRCADCFVRNPGWASWSLGIFLCVRCASLHRKLGTHVSKVKSLSMDTWTLEQVENMKRNGNVSSNRQYNPRNVKANIPTDADEVDSAMERFIREKYQHKTLNNEQRPLPTIRHHTGSSSSSNDIPPPLPPKTGPRLGTVRSSSAQYPQSKGQLPSPPASDATNSSAASRDARRMSRIPEDAGMFGSSGTDLKSKVMSMVEMGFVDEWNNAEALTRNDMNIGLAVQALLREQDNKQINGISFENPQSRLPQPSQISVGANVITPNSTNQTQQLSSSNPYNPFTNNTQAVQPQSLDHAFQNMSISQSQTQSHSQPLIRSNTGTFTQPQHHHTNSNPFHRTLTPPISPSLQNYNSARLQTQPTGHSNSINQANPFLRTSRSQTFASSNPYGSLTYQTSAAQSQQPLYQNQPSQPQQIQYQIQEAQQVPSIPNWAQRSVSQPMQLQQAQQFFQVQPMQTGLAFNQNQDQFLQQQQQQQQPQQIPQQNHQISNGYFQPKPQSQYQPQPYQQQPQSSYNPYRQQPQPLSSQSTGAAGTMFHDKTSILALYNDASAAPHQQMTMSANTVPSHNQQVPPETGQFHAPQRSVTMPLLAHPQTQSIQVPQIQAQPRPMATGHISRESMAFTGGMGSGTGVVPAGMGGRGSPNAFTGLSARWG